MQGTTPARRPQGLSCLYAEGCRGACLRIEHPCAGLPPISARAEKDPEWDGPRSGWAHPSLHSPVRLPAQEDWPRSSLPPSPYGPAFRLGPCPSFAPAARLTPFRPVCRPVASSFSGGWMRRTGSDWPKILRKIGAALARGGIPRAALRGEDDMLSPAHSGPAVRSTGCLAILCLWNVPRAPSPPCATWRPCPPYGLRTRPCAGCEVPRAADG